MVFSPFWVHSAVWLLLSVNLHGGNPPKETRKLLIPNYSLVWVRRQPVLDVGLHWRHALSLEIVEWLTL
jgi:hypothetical protein